jgi:hypothetical protein
VELTLVTAMIENYIAKGSDKQANGSLLIDARNITAIAVRANGIFLSVESLNC